MALLQDISIRTFTETFAEHNTEEDMKTYVRENLDIGKLTSEFNTQGSSFYFLRSGNALSGYMKLNEGASQTIAGKSHTLEIERIYVLKEFHGKQLGKLLLNFATGLAKEKQYAEIWLGVWEHNTKAIAFYERNGFITTGSHAFVLGTDEQTDHIMELQLN